MNEENFKEKFKNCIVRVIYACVWILAKIPLTIIFGGTLFIKGSLRNRPKTCHIAIARHRSRWDTLLLPLALLTTNIICVAREGLVFLWPIEHVKFLRKLFEGRMIVFINRDKITKSQWRLLNNVCKAKKHRAIVIFPEGQTDPKTRSVHPGFILLANEHNLPILPINIIPGFRYGKDKNAKWWRYLTLQAFFTRIHVGTSLSIRSSWIELRACQIWQKKSGKTEIGEKDEIYQELAEAAMEHVDSV